MYRIFCICFGTFFITLAEDFIGKATAEPENAVHLYNAGTDLLNKGDFEKATYFFEKCQSLNQVDLEENLLVNYANALIKLENFEKALDVSRTLFDKYQNKQAEHNIPILEKLLQKQDTEQEDKKSQQEPNNGEGQKDNEEDQTDDSSQDSSDNGDSKENKKSQQKQEKDQTDSSQDHKNSPQNDKKSNKQDNNPPDSNPDDDKDSGKSKKSQTPESKDKTAKKSQPQTTIKEDQLLEAIDNFDQDMMKFFAASQCGSSSGEDNEGW